MAVICSMALLLAGGLYAREHGPLRNIRADKRGPNPGKLYKISSLPAEEAKQVSPPQLPDTSGYTAEAVRAQMPDVFPVSLAVQNLEDSYVKVKRLLPMFGEMQQTLDPSAIVIIDGVYDLKTITDTVNDPQKIRRGENGEYILQVPILIKPDGTLLIKDGEHLVMSVSHRALISSFGHLYVVGADVKGWNLEEDKPAEFKENEAFRPYIVAWCGSEMNLAGSTFSHLGYFDSKAYGITYTSCNDTIYEEDFGGLPGAKGWVVDNRFEDIYYGFYSYESHDIPIVRNTYVNNVIYGIDPHDRSKNLIIAYNTVRGSHKKHGIIISREVDNSFIFHNVSEKNAGSGFMLDRDSVNNVIAYNILRQNDGDGLTFYESPDNLSYGNIMTGNKNSGMRIRNSWNITSAEDVISRNGVAGVQAYTSELSEEKRDLEMDPYQQKVSARITAPEMVGNQEAHFKMQDVERLALSHLKVFKSPDRFFGGELKGGNIELRPDLYESGKGVLIEHKEKAGTP